MVLGSAQQKLRSSWRDAGGDRELRHVPLKNSRKILHELNVVIENDDPGWLRRVSLRLDRFQSAPFGKSGQTAARSRVVRVDRSDTLVRNWASPPGLSRSARYGKTDLTLGQKRNRPYSGTDGKLPTLRAFAFGKEKSLPGAAS
jgi:hypothetical protein